jgi:protein-disulfide isomerase/uncharacterized membrane protein
LFCPGLSVASDEIKKLGFVLMDHKNISFSDASRQVRFWIYWIFIFAGIGVLLWSAQHWYAVQAGVLKGKSFCNFSAYWNCEGVALSDYSSLFGVPIGVFGAAWFFIFAILGLSQSVSKKVLMLVFAAGVLASAYYAFTLFFVLETGCLVCVAGYVCILGAGAMAFWGPRWTPLTTGLSAFVLALGFGVLALSVYGMNESHRLPFSQEELDKFRASLSQVPVEELSVVSPLGKGSENGDIHIMEFSDFACPHCATAGLETVPQLLNDPQIRFSFFPYPRDGACHPQVPSHIQPGTCRLSEAALCAQEQGKFWEFHDVVFGNMRDNSRLIPLEQAVSKAGLDPEKLQECFDRGEAQEQLRAMIELAIEKDVRATPTFFINGRRLPGNFPIPIFRIAIDEIRRIDAQE